MPCFIVGILHLAVDHEEPKLILPPNLQFLIVTIKPYVDMHIQLPSFTCMMYCLLSCLIMDIANTLLPIIVGFVLPDL